MDIWQGQGMWKLRVWVTKSRKRIRKLDYMRFWWKQKRPSYSPENHNIFNRDSLINANNEICGNKMPTRCNRGFYCRSYCLLNMFRAPLRPSSGAQEYYTVVAACGISCCGFQVAGLVWSWGLFVRFPGCTTGSNHCIILLSSWWWA